jgi:hypothetical protein
MEARQANHKALVRSGWPQYADNRRYFQLKPYGRVYTAFVKGKGFWMHIEGGSRVAFGRHYDTALKALVRILEPEEERIDVVDNHPAPPPVVKVRAKSLATAVSTMSA